MEFPFLQYNGKTIPAKLIVKDEDGSFKIFCFIRKIYLQLTPEEKVRQAFLWFLCYGSKYSKSWRNKFLIRVERSDIDISLSLKLNVEGFESIPLFLIVEIKVFNDSYIEKQLCKYVSRKNCWDCLFFYASSAIYLKWNFKTQRFSRTVLNDFSEIDDLINTLANSNREIMNRHIDLFDKAKMGDYESFKNLVEMYGIKCTMKFKFERDKKSYQVIGFLFKINGDDIFYNVRGIYTKKKQRIIKENFRGLVSITD